MHKVVITTGNVVFATGNDILTTDYVTIMICTFVFTPGNIVFTTGNVVSLLFLSL